MDESEFDKFAEEYKTLYKGVIGITGEDTDFFAEYKIKDTKEISKTSKYQDNLSILDFGSGIGESVPFFLKYFPSSELTCIDVSQKSLDIGMSRFKDDANFVHFDGQRIPYEDSSFDLIFTACVFHHIPVQSHELLLSEIFRVLKPEGTFVVFEHNPYNFLTVRAVNACPFDENAVLIRANDFDRKLTRAGLVDRKLRYRIFFPRILKWLRPIEKYITWLPLGAQYYVAGKKPA